MPPHPLNACCCHLIAQAIANIQRLTESNDKQHVLIEINHIAPIVAMLDEWLLRKDWDSLERDALHYWQTARPQYIRQADPQSVTDFDTCWDCLAYALDLPFDSR